MLRWQNYSVGAALTWFSLFRRVTIRLTVRHQDANEEPAQVTWRTIFYHEVESLFVREWRQFYGVSALSF